MTQFRNPFWAAMGSLAAATLLVGAGAGCSRAPNPPPAAASRAMRASPSELFIGDLKRLEPSPRRFRISLRAGSAVASRVASRAAAGALMHETVPLRVGFLHIWAEETVAVDRCPRVGFHGSVSVEGRGG
jgi:hypothetical protein